MATNTMPVARAGDLFWLWWAFAGLLGAVGGLLIKTVVEIVAGIAGFEAALEAIPPILFGTLLGVMLGVATGLGQWLVLRRRLAGTGLWVAATLASYTLFWTLHNSGLLPFANSPWGFVLQGFGHGALAGAVISSLQYLVLRGRVPDARRWVLISAIGWSLGGALGHFVLDVVLALANIHGPFDILLISTLAALFSGFGLQRLLRTAM